MSIQNILTSSRLKKLQLFIPPSSNPLLTCYMKSLNEKIIPLKQKFNVFSQLSIRKQEKSIDIFLSKKQLSQVKRSYKALKNLQQSNRSKKVIENDQQYVNDPSYKSLIKLRQKMTMSIMKRKQQIKNKLDRNQQYYEKNIVVNKDEQIVEVATFKFRDNYNQSREYQRMFLTQSEIEPRQTKIKNKKNNNSLLNNKKRAQQKQKQKQKFQGKQPTTIKKNIQRQIQWINQIKIKSNRILKLKNNKKVYFRGRAQSLGSLSKIQ